MGVSAVIAIGGAYMASEAAKSAAETQAGAGREAMSTQERMLAQQRELQQPYITAGQSALERLIAGTAAGGEFATPFKMEESQAQQFATKESLAAMQSQMATGGQALSSNAIAGAGKLAGNIGSQYEQQAYNQWLQSRKAQMDPLQNIAAMGQASASGVGANIGSAGSNISNLQTGIGNVQAAGQVGAAAPYANLTSGIGSLLLAQGMQPAQQQNPNAGPSTGQTTLTTYQGYDPVTGQWK